MNNEVCIFPVVDLFIDLFNNMIFPFAISPILSCGIIPCQETIFDGKVLLMFQITI